jgi:hypothetical protein
MEAMNDPRKLQVEEEESTRMFETNSQNANGGVDPYFNALRVFPPFVMNYPDLREDKDTFYDLIGSPHLKQKYDL